MSTSNGNGVERVIVVVLTESTAVDVAEAISVRKSKLQDMASNGVHISPEKLENLSKAGRVYDLALAQGRSEEGEIVA
jgi:hypothetical protein